MSTIKVWGIGTPRTLRVHWALHELDLAYDCEPVMPRSEGARSSEYARLNASVSLRQGCLISAEAIA